MDLIFDDEKIISYRKFAAKNILKSDFLLKHSANELASMAHAYKDNYNSILDYGARHGLLKKEFDQRIIYKKLHQVEFCEGFNNLNPHCQVVNLNSWEFSKDQFDLVASNLNLHFANNILNLIKNVHDSLISGGIFVGSIFGEDSLINLRTMLMHLEEKFSLGKFSNRVIPFIRTKNMVDLLRINGFQEVVVSKETLKVKYDHIKNLFQDLKNMGERNYLMNLVPLKKSVVNELYNKKISIFNANSFSFEDQFDIIYFVGIKK